MSHHIIDFKDVVFRYPDGTEALKGISFRITHGESVGIVGANGAGKSTLLLQMNGYILPSSGLISIGDLELTKKTRQEIRKKVGVVFQNPDDQLFMPTVYDDVAFGPLNLGMSAERVIHRVNSALQTVGCLALREKPPHHLVMDEPSSDLDPKSRRYLMRLLKGFKHTKIIASHDLDFILELCERCLIIKDGLIVADGPVLNILSDQSLLEENNLELPLTLQKAQVK